MNSPKEKELLATIAKLKQELAVATAIFLSLLPISLVSAKLPLKQTNTAGLKRLISIAGKPLVTATKKC